MQSQNRFFDDLARVASGAVGALSGIRGELEARPRDPFDSNDTRFCCDLAQQLAAAKNEVTLFLVQNGVLPARTGARSDALTQTAGAGVKVLADSFSLKERGIAENRLASGVAAAP